MTQDQRPLFHFTLTFGTFAVLMAAVAAGLFVGAIWTGDIRFAQTAAIPLIVGFISGAIWIVKVP